MQMKLITGPETPVITLPEAKAHLRVTHSEEDDLISSLVDAATGWLDGWPGVLGLALMPQTWEMSLAGFPSGCIKVPLGPVTSITSITYRDGYDVTQTVSPADYTLWENILTGFWPDGTSVKIRYEAGTGCPDPIKMVVKLLVGHWYENREAAGAKVEIMPMAVDMLIAPYRRVGF